MRSETGSCMLSEVEQSGQALFAVRDEFIQVWEIHSSLSNLESWEWRRSSNNRPHRLEITNQWRDGHDTCTFHAPVLSERQLIVAWWPGIIITEVGYSDCWTITLTINPHLRPGQNENKAMKNRNTVLSAQYIPDNTYSISSENTFFFCGAMIFSGRFF